MTPLFIVLGGFMSSLILLGIFNFGEYNLEVKILPLLSAVEDPAK
jgi:hypothetical protein